MTATSDLEIYHSPELKDGGRLGRQAIGWGIALVMALLFALVTIAA